MNHRIQPILMLVLLSSLILHPSSLARADGGAVRLRQRAGGYQIAVFTSPTPFRAGPVDVSVLVQDAATGECVPEAQVTVCLKAPGAGRVLECPATTEAATNQALPRGRLRTTGAGLVGCGSCRRRAARAGPSPVWG